MSDENTTTFVDPNTDDLDAFNDLMTGKAQPIKAEDTPVEDDAKEPDEKAPLDADIEDDTLATVEPDIELEDGEEAEASKPEPKKNSFQKRIDEINGKYREEQRAREALEKRLAAIEAGQTKEPIKPDVSGEPTPDDKLEDGTEKYPLGEFDPAFIRDLNTHIFEEKMNEFRTLQEAEKENARDQEAKTSLVKEWEGKLETARETYPDLDEKNEALEELFMAFDTGYAEYLASTIMSMDSGPEVLYYLANNIDEAKRITSSGPTKATIALGRLEAILDKSKVTKDKEIRVSRAPEPPPVINKGNSGRNGIADDTDDLDAFEKKFFAKKR